MSEDILVITNNHNSSLTYTPTLMAYGYHVNEAQTFAGARIRLRAGMIPNIIIMDTKFQMDDCYEFAYTVRTTSKWSHIQMIIIGKELEVVDAQSMNILQFQRPASIEKLLTAIHELELI